MLLVLRALRILSAALFSSAPHRRARPGMESEMVRDPVCGTWIDRRLALTGRRGAERVPVCSETCRGRLEARG
ncbi:MAG TPA: hypothetical protein VLO07_00680 [Thermoanaerobaculia bacterium]|nr:hypothetical protein [Thermoanaerobaculia bacterium]